MVEQCRKRLARERQRNLKRRRKVTNAEPRVEVEIMNTTLNNDNIRSVEVEVSITTNMTNIQINQRQNWITRYKLGRMDQTCAYCEAKFWMEEKDHKEERCYLRTLFTYVKGATSFDHLKTVNEYLCASFKEACIRLGLLQDETEWNAYLLEASRNPKILWNNHKVVLCEDILYREHQLTQNQDKIISKRIEWEALHQLECYLILNDKLLKNFPNMLLLPEKMLNSNYNEDLDQLIQKERSYNAIENEAKCFFVDSPDRKLSDLIDFIYPNLVKNSSNINYIVSRAILTPKNDNVENISSLIMDQFPGELYTYPSTNDVSLMEDVIQNSLKYIHQNS
ncbi:12190_t:CDS:2 [Racocetra persica]|uniref:12190_t:CDS:1 n=1 Tax=Racocetra persica TaxID=160502 RepID=A0ACA9KLI9_9GLOM|nr:12190_t:CDS:2 [Racocetra persica]